jgi:putative membrane protein
MATKKQRWFITAFEIKGSVILAIYQQVIFSGMFGVFISILYHYKLPVYQPVLGTFITSIVLGLLLVFRTNTAYKRYWEGRKIWGSMVNTIRNLARQIWGSVDENSLEDKDNKFIALNLLLAFAVATKLQLRGEKINSELEALMPAEKYQNRKIVNNPPIEIAF